MCRAKSSSEVSQSAASSQGSLTQEKITIPNINQGEELVSVKLNGGQGLLPRVHMARMASIRISFFFFFKWQCSRCFLSQKYPRLRCCQQPHANVLIRVRMWQVSLLLTGTRRVWDVSSGAALSATHGWTHGQKGISWTPGRCRLSRKIVIFVF